MREYFGIIFMIDPTKKTIAIPYKYGNLKTIKPIFEIMKNKLKSPDMKLYLLEIDEKYAEEESFKIMNYIWEHSANEEYDVIIEALENKEYEIVDKLFEKYINSYPISDRGVLN